MLNGLDLFSGIGGLSLALSEWIQPVAYVEIDAYCQRVLAARMRDGLIPAAPVWDDVRSFDGLPLRGVVDVIYGGFPCQDISAAGRGEGVAGERSGLFFEIVRLAQEIKPALLFLENVPAIRTRGLSVVARELAGLRYDLRWGTLSAYDVGAPHKRDRWWLLAYARSNAAGRHLRGLPQADATQNRPEVVNQDAADFARNAGAYPEVLADADGGRRESERFAEPCGLEGACGHVADGCGEVRKQLDGEDACSGWSVEPDVDRMAHGVPARVDRLRALGNAVVPAQAREAFRRLSGL